MNSSQEHLDVSIVSKQAVTPSLVLQWLVAVCGLAGVYATGVANDRELTTKIAAQQAQIDLLRSDATGYRTDLRSDIREIKDEIRELRSRFDQKK